MPQLSHLESCLARIQTLPAHKKDQIQDFRNWVQNEPESTIRSVPESLIIGLIENPSVSMPSAEMAGTSNKPNPEVFEHTHAAAKGTSNSGRTGNSGAEGSKGHAVRLVPFQSMPQSAQEELGKEFFLMILCCP